MKHAALFILFLVSITAIQAQRDGRRDFSGTWERSVENVNVPKIPGVKHRSFLRIVIEHVGPVFTITTNERVESYDKGGKILGSKSKVLTKTTHYTDKRGEKNVDPKGVEHESETRWDDDEIFVDGKFRKTYIFRYSYRYSLSKDGTKLTLTYSTASMMPGRLSVSRTYSKVP